MILTKVPESEVSKKTESSTETGSNRMPAIIPFEEHQRLLDEAAKRASRETLESYRKLEESRRSARRENDGGVDDFGGGDEGEDEIDFFATKTNKSIRNMVSSVATLKKAFEQPPSQIEQAMYQAFTQKTIDSLSGTSEKKKNWYDEILSSFAHGLGARGPEFIESLTRNFGSDWVKQTATGLLNPGAIVNNGGYGGSGGQGQGGMGGSQIRDVGGKSDLNQDAVDQIMALDPNNPSHVSAYAEIQGNIDINDARKMLQIHQDIFMNKMKRNAVQQTIDIDNPRDIRVNSSVPPNVPVNSDVPPVWAQALMGKILELENKVNQVCADVGIDTDITIPKVTIPKISDTIGSVDSGGIGKVQTAEEFQRELEEETIREKTKSGIGNVNKWEDDPSTAVGVVSHERRLEEEQMRKKPVHDASAELVMRELDNQKEKLELKNTTVESFEEEKVEIPVNIDSDIDKIVESEEEVKEEEIKEVEEKEEVEVKEEEKNNSTNIVLIPEKETKEIRKKAPKSVIDEPKEEIKEFPKGSQGWLKEQQKKKKVV